MCRLGAFLAVLFLSASSITVFAETEWFYSNLADPNAHQMILSPTHIKGHLQADAKTCPNDSPFLCYESAGFQFAVPRVLGKDRVWRFHGARYEIRKEASLTLLGKTMTIIWIDQTTNNSAFRFLYSKPHGLIGFSSLKPKGALFILENGCGYGASAECIDRSE